MVTHRDGETILKMPFFNNKLLNKKTSKRKFIKSPEEKNDNNLISNIISLQLDDMKATFSNGQWIPQFGPLNETTKENNNLKRKLSKLQEEYNLLRLKYEILLDMLTQKISISDQS